MKKIEILWVKRLLKNISKKGKKNDKFDYIKKLCSTNATQRKQKGNYKLDWN